MSYVKIGVAGPVGSGKTALIEALSRKMANDYSIGVITNDIYTKEDAQFLAKNTSACAWHRLPSSRRSAWRPAAARTPRSARMLR